MVPRRSDRSDWVEGERVFGPPGGTYDADWVAGASCALEPGLGRADALRLTVAAWGALRGGVAPDDLADALGGPHAGVVAAAALEYCALYGVGPARPA